MSGIYSKGSIVEILTGQFKGEKGIVKRQIGTGGYYEVNPVVNNKIINLHLILHSNELIKRG